MLKKRIIPVQLLIDNNLVKQKDSKIQLYTIHSYKGLENNNVRIYSDIDHDEEKNLYYVSLTRGKESTIVQRKKEIKKKSVDIFNKSLCIPSSTNLTKYNLNKIYTVLKKILIAPNKIKKIR